MSSNIYTTIDSYLKNIYLEHGDQIAIKSVSDGAEYDYRHFQYFVDMLARGLMAHGIDKGDHVGILAPNSTEWVALLVAITKIGGVAVCLNTGINNRGIRYAINFSDAKIVITTTGFLQKLDMATGKYVYRGTKELEFEEFPSLRRVFTIDPDMNCTHQATIHAILKQSITVSVSQLKERADSVRPEDVAAIQFTSGTTGNPKAVETTQASLVRNAVMTAKSMNYTDKDIVLLGAPLFHILGYVGSALTTLVVGATLIVMKKFQTTKALQTLESEHCTGFHGVPTMYQFFLEKCRVYQLRNLKKGMIAGTFCKVELVNSIFRHLKLDLLVNVYGQTESLSIGDARYTRPQFQQKELPFTLLDGVTIKIVDKETGEELPANQPGELIIQTPYLMKGYYKNEEATRKNIIDGWLYTGDLAMVDEDGKLTLCGRKSDLIIRGGENILPKEIEKILLEHPKIQEVVVVGVPDSLLGEEIAAFIVSEKDVDLTEDEVYSFAHENLAKQECPRYIRFVDEFPYTESGKVKKYVLAESLEEEYSNECNTASAN